MFLDIKKEVNYLIESCSSTELASLVKETGAYIIDNIDLPKSTLGMTVRSDGQTAILISSNVKGPKKEFIIAHELGHNILHRGQSTTFFRRFSAGLQIPQVEAEANEFALYLLLRCSEIDTKYSFNVFDFVRSYELPDSMARFIKYEKEVK